MIDPADKDIILEYMEQADFDYLFRYHTTFPDIQDPEFHELREAYIEAADALEDYIKGDDKDDE